MRVSFLSLALAYMISADGLNIKIGIYSSDWKY